MSVPLIHPVRDGLSDRIPKMSLGFGQNLTKPARAKRCQLSDQLVKVLLDQVVRTHHAPTADAGIVLCPGARTALTADTNSRHSRRCACRAAAPAGVTA